MRVPPDQSCHGLAPPATPPRRGRAGAAARVMRVSRVPNTKLSHARLGVAERVRKVQQHARVAAHRARRCRPAPPSARAACAGGASASSHSSPPWRAIACSVARQSARPGARRASAAPRGQRLEQPAQSPQRALRGAPFVGAHGVEVGLAQQLALADQVSARRTARCVGLRLRRARRRGFGNSASARRRFSRCSRRSSAVLRLHLGQQHRQHAAEQVGVAPEQLERLVEQRRCARRGR